MNNEYFSAMFMIGYLAACCQYESFAENNLKKQLKGP